MIGKKNIFTLVCVIVFVVSAYTQDEFTMAKKGEPAPDFTFEYQPGKTKKLSDLKGKVVWINFFATWCPPCRKELPHLQSEVYDKFKDNPGFELLIFGREHDWKTVNKFKKENNFTMPFYPDVERKLFAKYANQNIPRNFLITKNGKIIFSSIGFTVEEFAELKKVLEENLN